MNKNLTRSGNKGLNQWPSFRGDFWDLFDRFSQDLTPFSGDDQFMPNIEVRDTGKSYKVNAEIPGMTDKDINITLKDNNLILEGERQNEFEEDDKKGNYRSEFSYGRFYRSIPLTEDVDADKVTASCRDGVLKIELPKLPDTERKAKKIAIKH